MNAIATHPDAPTITQIRPMLVVSPSQPVSATRLRVRILGATTVSKPRPKSSSAWQAALRRSLGL